MKMILLAFGKLTDDDEEFENEEEKKKKKTKHSLYFYYDSRFKRPTVQPIMITISPPIIRVASL